MECQSLGVKRKATHFITEVQLHLKVNSTSDLFEAGGKLSPKSDIRALVFETMCLCPLI